MGKPKHLMILRLSAMGDVAMLVPVLRCLYAQNQNIQITLVTRKRFVPIFKEFKELQIISPDFIGKHKGLKGLYRLYKELKQIKPNRIADIHHNLRTRILRLFFRLSFTRVKVIDKGYAERKRLTHPTKKTMKPLTPQHYRYVEVFPVWALHLMSISTNFQSNQAFQNRVCRFTFQLTENGLGLRPLLHTLAKYTPST